MRAESRYAFSPRPNLKGMSTGFLYGEPGSKCSGGKSGGVKNEREGKDGKPHIPEEKSETKVPRSKKRVRNEARRGSSLKKSICFSGSLAETRGSFRITICSIPYVCAPNPARTPPLFIMAPVPSRAAILRLINASQHTGCPCHGSHTAHNSHAITNQLRRLATPVDKVEKEYAFEVVFALMWSWSRLQSWPRLLHPIFASGTVLLVRSVWI